MPQEPPQPAPGEARCEGPSARDIISQDAHPASAALLSESYTFLGDADIPFSRYTSKEFFDREISRLWPRTWQWACRLEHVPEVGDTYVYDVGPYSVIIVRSAQATVRAFLNSCSHRGTRICAAAGTGSVQIFRCPFHGWSWQLDGSINNIPARWDFPHAGDDTHRLQDVLCETWAGFVFINIDPQASPLAESLGVMQDHFADCLMEDRQISVHIEKTLPANWKAAQEAFMEAYHNFETHDSPTGGNTAYDIFSDTVSRFIHNIGTYSPASLADYPGDKWREPPLTENELLQGLGIPGLDTQTVDAGNSARAIAAAEIRRRYSESLQRDLSSFSDSLLLDSIEYHLFPNMFFFPGLSIPMVYRFRPNGDDVDSCIFDLLVLELLPSGEAHAEPPEPIKLGIEQSYTEAEQLGWLGHIYDQDTGNLQLQQQGFKTSRKPGLTLGNYQEARIRQVHQTLDQYLTE